VAAFLALIAFASNSLLTRLALGAHRIDASTFTLVRLVSGAAMLSILVRARAGSWAPLRGTRAVLPVALFAYAAPFSFAYLRIGAAAGALVLFGAVQLSMIGWALARGERPTPAAWVGIVLAVAGLVALTAPAAARPDPVGAGLMVVAGVAWAVYTVTGRGSGEPVAANARSFLWSVPPAVALLLVAHPSGTADASGIALAVVSGAVTSGLGYALWYRALPGLTVTQAAVAQLAVPVIAAFGAVLLLHERLSLRLVLCGACVLAGVGLVVLSKSRR
jgi:drug/metabolite transporter (DMT)-like permease